MSHVKKLSDIIGHGYSDVWNDNTHRYIVIKGSRASKKTTTAALRLVYEILSKPLANGLVIRRYYNTLKDSIYADIERATTRFGVKHLFSFNKSPLEITYKPTGQKILFRGFDDANKIQSIAVPFGYITKVIIEEAFELENSAEFDKLDLSLRGEMPQGYFRQIWLIFNPYADTTWLKSRFFDNPDEDTYSCTKNYTINEFLDEEFLKRMEVLKRTRPTYYSIVGEGNWGIAEGLIFNEEDYMIRKMPIQLMNTLPASVGLDFGFTNDPTAIVEMRLDKDNQRIYIPRTHVGYGMLNSEIASVLHSTYGDLRVKADAAAPKDISDLRHRGVNVTRANKGPDSIMNGIKKLKEYTLVIDPSCEELLEELRRYVYDDKSGKPIDKYNHCIDAMRYGLQGFKSLEKTSISWNDINKR